MWDGSNPHVIQNAEHSRAASPLRRKAMNTDKRLLVDDGWRIPYALWQRIEPLLPVEGSKPKGGRPSASAR